ncbi:hypothetical protein HPB48_002197 [Haemaphysalis longicornis]|uniref:Uncharacterized protein n=1 Tax=Haemaphysalis longicornis TaxID=44386 RepID=A0A9J6FH16_HAELO|nr:hypothetical protein HPB48_002197 [Haemaphysalis longicornis]
MLTQQNKTLALQPARNKEPYRGYMQPQRNPLPFLGDAEWDGARRSLLALFRPYNMHMAADSDLGDDENGLPLRVYRKDTYKTREEHDGEVQRTLLPPLTGPASSASLP